MDGKQSILYGVALSIIVPTAFVLIINAGVMLYGEGFTTGMFQASLLFGVAINVPIERWFNKKKKDYLSRGILIGSFFVFIFWVVRFLVLENN